MSLTPAWRACMDLVMRYAAVALFSLACASREIPAPVPVAVRGGLSQPQAASPQAAPPQAAPPQPQKAQPAAAEDTACTTDADCGLTRVPSGACCPSLCEPRVVSAKTAAALEAAAASCRRACPEPQCAPQRFIISASCQAGRCTARQEPMQ